MQAIEKAVINNKWLTFAWAVLFFALSLGVFAVMHTSNSGADCYLDAEQTLFDSGKRYVHEVPEEAIVEARTHYNVCLLANGIDVRSVPAFEELFPFTANMEQSYKTNNYTDVDWPLE
jgi:hypothetical protein